MKAQPFGHRLSARWVLLLATAWMTATAVARPVVIHDSDQTEPIGQYLMRLETRSAPVPRRAAVHHPPVKGISAERLLPIRTPEMRPGALEPRNVATRLHRPLFLIGADPLSRHWLAQSRDRLVAMGAVGLLVEAKTKAQLQAVAALARGLPIAPASASSIANALALHTYPVLITAEGIAQ